MAARKSSGRKQSSKRKSSARKSVAPRDAIALLRADHQLVQGLFDKFEKTRAEDRKSALAEQICNELTVHAQIEEEIFYPAARDAIRDEDLIHEADGRASKRQGPYCTDQGERGQRRAVRCQGEGARGIRQTPRPRRAERALPQVRKTKLDLQELGQQLSWRARKS